MKLEKSKYERLGACLAVQHQPIPLHFSQVLLVIAEEEPCTFQKVIEKLDLSISAVSRTVMALGQLSRRGQPGFDLLATFRDPKEGRRFLIKLTPKGKVLVRQLKGI